MDVIAGLRDRDGQAADKISADTQVRLEDTQNLLKIPKSECPDFWIRVGDPVVPLERNFYGHPLAGLLWERQFEEVLLELEWDKIPNWECLFVQRQQGLFSSENLDDIKMSGKKQNMAPMWKKLMKNVNLNEPISFLDHENLGCTQRERKPNETTNDEYRKCLNFLLDN